MWAGGEGLALAKLRGLVLPDLRMAGDLEEDRGAWCWVGDCRFCSMRW